MAIATQTRTVPPFDGIELKGTGTLHVKQAPETSLTIEADSETLDKIVTDVEGNTLVIRFKWLDALFALRALGPIDFHITTPDLRLIRINGAGTVLGESPIVTDRLFTTVSGSGKVALEIQAEELRASVSGSGDYRLRGSAGRQEITISGNGDYEAVELATRDTDVTITGSGRVRLRASERLDVTISGAGRVEYAGTPTISQRISGSGTIVQASAAAAASEPASSDTGVAPAAAGEAAATDADAPATAPDETPEEGAGGGADA